MLDLSPIRSASQRELLDPHFVEALIYEFGIGPPRRDPFTQDTFPLALRYYCGRGLRIYQNPQQFAHYLIHLAGQQIQSYLEIGTCFGGSFIFTVEYLNRFHPLKRKLAVDTTRWEGENLTEYQQFEDFEFFLAGSRSAAFRALIRDQQFDLAMIDGDHSYEGVRADYELIKERVRWLAVHDIACPTFCPGVVQFWNEIKTRGATVVEFTHRFGDCPHNMGIGLLENPNALVPAPPRAAARGRRSRPVLNIVTAASRPQNLARLRTNLAASFREIEVRWYCVFDSRKVENPTVEGFYYSGRVPGDCSGAPQKNLCLADIREGWVYFLDDDNLFPAPFEEALVQAIHDHPAALGFIFNQTLPDGTLRLRADDWQQRPGTIDCGQFVLQRAAIGSTRFLPDTYSSDFYFFQDIYRRFHASIRRIDVNATYYNALVPG